MKWRARCASSVPAFRLRRHASHGVRETLGREGASGRLGRRPLQVRRSNRLGGGGAGYAILEQGNELRGVVGRGETGLAGADDGEGFAGGEMRESFFEGKPLAVVCSGQTCL